MTESHAWDVLEGEDGMYRVAWRPARGHPEYPGRTYTPGDSGLPDDFPAEATKENLKKWGDQRWGKPFGAQARGRSALTGRAPTASERNNRLGGATFLLAFGAAAVGAGLVRTVASTYLPLVLAEIRDAPALIGLAMLVNSAAGFAVPLLVGRWSDHRHNPRHGRRLFIAGGTLMTTSGLLAVVLGHGSSFVILTLSGAVVYFGVNVVTTAHRALVHDCFRGVGYARGTGTQEVAALAGGLIVLQSAGC